jgi:hypothetical protein
MTGRAGARGAAAALCAAAALAAGAPTTDGRPPARPAPATAARAPVVEQMVVFRHAKAKAKRVSARGVHVRVGHRRCAVATGTPLAALVRSKPGRLHLRDYGSCGRRARDAGGLFVTAISRERNHGQRGWVYKVGRKAATASAADPSGPFGHGRLRSGRRVVWFYCLRATDCQRTLAVRSRVEPGGRVRVKVVGYDDAGRGALVPGATVRLGALRAGTGPDGRAAFTAPPGRHRLYAAKPGLVRSFPERVAVP